jgi:hypothetical protein
VPEHDEKRLGELLAHRFFQRRDVVAIYAPNPNVPDGYSWQPRKSPLKGSDLLKHLRGELALGTYLLDQEDTCRFYTLDLDLDKEGMSYVGDTDALNAMLSRPVGAPIDLEWVECKPREVWKDLNSPMRPWLVTTVRMLAQGLASRVIHQQHYPVAVAASGGKGMHVHVFCGERPAADARALANAMLESWVLDGEDVFIRKGSFAWKHRSEMYGNITMEVFPKQDQIDKNGFGNLVRLPLGVHPVTKRRSYFVDTQSDPVLEPAAELDPITALEQGCRP